MEVIHYPFQTALEPADRNALLTMTQDSGDCFVSLAKTQDLGDCFVPCNDAGVFVIAIRDSDVAIPFRPRWSQHIAMHYSQ